eukprot:COSAG04_NODE_141_length_23595_cov_4.393003_3_plen_48_part_00
MGRPRRAHAQPERSNYVTCSAASMGSTMPSKITRSDGGGGGGGGGGW